MKSYWFFLEPFVIIEQKSKKILLYNSVSGKYLGYNNTGLLSKLISELRNKESNYCISINDEIYANDQLKKFFSQIREKYFGDIVDKQTCIKKPIILPPILNFQKDGSRLTDPSQSISADLFENLIELNYYINSDCEFNCKLCSTSYKQHFTCKNGFSKDLKVEEIINFQNQLAPENNLKRINITGGNILLYKDLSKLNEALKGKYESLHYHINFKNIEKNIEDNLKLLKELKNIDLILQFPLHIERLKPVLNLLNSVKINTRLVFLILNEDEYNEAMNIVKLCEIDDYEIAPVYAGSNLSFFEEYIFIDRADIELTKITKKQYFTNQILNIYNFGKLTINNDGNVFSNFNCGCLGNITTNTLKELLKKELSESNSWLKIRDDKTCVQCVYQFFCPPLSNYEFVMGKFNLCNVKN